MHFELTQIGHQEEIDKSPGWPKQRSILENTP